MLRSSGCMGLMSGSAHWLMSRASGQAAAAGLRLGRKSHSRGGHVSAPDPHSCRGLPGLEALPGPGPYLRDLGLTRGTRHALLGAPDPLVQGSGVLPRRSGPIDAPWGVLSFLATRCSQPCPCCGVGCCFPCDRGCRTGAASSYCRRGYPCFKVPTVALGPASGEDVSLQVGPKLD